MHMDNLTNKEPGIEDSTVQDSANKEQKKKESRPVIRPFWSFSVPVRPTRPTPSG